MSKELPQKFLPYLSIKQMFLPYLNIKQMFSPIKVDVQFRKDIIVSQDFDLNPKELSYMYDLVGDKAQERREKIARLFFAMGFSVREISKHYNISKTTIYDSISVYKKQVVDEIKGDLRKNKKVLGHMVQLMNQTDHQIRELWKKYNEMEANSGVIRRALNAAEEGQQQQRSLRNVVSAAKASMAIHDRQMACLDLLGKKTKQMLEIWEKFGLTGDEAIKIILSGGIDVDVKIQEIRSIVVNLTEIIQEEVTDKEKRHKIFGRMAKRISNSGIGKEYVDEPKQVDLLPY